MKTQPTHTPDTTAGRATPGPWKAKALEKAGLLASIEIEGPNGEIIARVVYQDSNGTREANARLISQSPAMLEACMEVMQDWHDLGKVGADTVEKCRACIARAKGEA